MDIKKLKLGMYLFYCRYVKGMLFILNQVCIGYVLFSKGYVTIIGHPVIASAISVHHGGLGVSRLSK